MKIGVWELVVIFVIALVVIGPDKFPDFARMLGKGIKDLRKAANDMSREFRENVAEPLDEAKKPFEEALEPFQEVADGIREADRTIKDSMKPGGLRKKVKEEAVHPQKDVSADKETVSESEEPESPEASGVETPAQEEPQEESAGNTA